MKNIKRVACLVLTLLMVVSTMSVFAAFSDVPATASYDEAVSALNQLGIINGYGDGTFKPDNDVTRAEFTAMLMRTLGAGSVGSTSAAELPFTDLDDNNTDVSWAYPNINTAYKNGIINGYEDNTFRPNDNVLYEEAVKMIVCGLGYGNGISVDTTPWYSNFVNQARQLGITKNAQNIGSVERPASRACIAQMLYDSLEIPLVENGTVTTKTALGDYLGYVKNTGYISANDLTSLDDPDVTLRDNQIQIRAKEPGSTTYEVHTYTVSDASQFKDKLGYQIDYFYPKPSTSDSIRTLFSYEVKSNTIVELDASMIEPDECTRTAIKYYPDENSALSNANLASENIVIYNGKLYGPNAASSTFSVDMLPNVGTVTLLDSDQDNKYDVITIWSYELYYVSSKSSSEYSIVDNATRNTDKTLVLDPDADTNLDLVDKSGNEVTFGSITTGSVICYAQSNTGNGGTDYKRAVVVTDKASGSVSSVRTGEEVVINGTTYKYSNAAPWMENGNDGTLEEPTTSDSGTFALDINGNLFAYSKSTTDTSSVNYGYVLAYDEGDSAFGTIDDFQVRILTQNNAKTDFHIRKGTTVNGVSCSTAEDFLNALYEGSSYQKTGDTARTGIQQVVKYTTSTRNGNACIDTLYTVTADTDVTGGQTVENDKLYNLAELERGTVKLTYANSKLSNSTTGTQLSVGSSVVFVVPDQSERGNSENFKKTTASSYFSSGKSYESVEAFDVSKTNSARVIVVYGGSTSTEVDETSPVCVVSENPGQESVDGTSLYKVSGYKITRGNTKGTFDTYASTSSNAVVRDMQIGDIYRTGEDSDGYLTFDSQYRLYPASEGYIDTGSARPANWNSADYCVIYGSVYAADSTEAVVVIPSLLGADDDYSDEAQYTIAASSFNNAKILKYDTSGRNTEVLDVTEDRTAVLDSLAGLYDGLNPSKVLIYMYQGSVKLLVITEE